MWRQIHVQKRAMCGTSPSLIKIFLSLTWILYQCLRSLFCPQSLDSSAASQESTTIVESLPPFDKHQTTFLFHQSLSKTLWKHSGSTKQNCYIRFVSVELLFLFVWVVSCFHFLVSTDFYVGAYIFSHWHKSIVEVPWRLALIVTTQLTFSANKIR